MATVTILHPVESSRPAAHPRRHAEIDITRLFRAHVSPASWRGTEVTTFVEAGTREAAIRKIAGAIAALEYRKPEEVTERIYNLASAEELIAEGLSESHAERLLETGWSGNRAVSFVESPLVLLANPGPLLRVWAQLQRPTIA
jgi:hypothetical protein